MAESETIATTRRTVEAWTRGDEESIRAAFAEDMVYEPTGAIPGYQEPVNTTQSGINTASVAIERRVVMHARMLDRRCVSYAAFETEAEALSRAGLESWPEAPN